MVAMKSFKVFGELVQILVHGEQTHNCSTTVIQISPPGGGPPPHQHLHEDETFVLLEGDYEMLLGDVWHKIHPGQAIHGPRNVTHTWRNVGQTTGKMLVFVAPAGMDHYLEAISKLSMPADVEQLMAISARYGISFPAN